MSYCYTLDVGIWRLKVLVLDGAIAMLAPIELLPGKEVNVEVHISVSSGSLRFGTPPIKAECYRSATALGRFTVIWGRIGVLSPARAFPTVGRVLLRGSIR